MRTATRVLAVDDNPTNLAVIEETLGDHFTLKLEQNGNDALRAASTFLPDVVLLDVMMPDLDGFEVCSRLRSDPVLKHSHVVMVSAKTTLEDRLRGYGAGADDYVTKPFDEEELLAKVNAIVTTKSMYHDTQAHLDSLCGAAGETLELLAYLRDAETGEHLDRMREYSLMLAGELRTVGFSDLIDDKFLDDLHRASALHDIGKLVLPDAILKKPGPLTDIEFKEVKQHTVTGEAILYRLAGHQSETTFFKMAAEIARWHHECFDGSGYPDGLQGEAIPLAARIVKVADVFDALTSWRVYKPAFQPTRAKEQIVQGRGTEFDPNVVEAMLQVFDELEEVCQGQKAGNAQSSTVGNSCPVF